MENLFGKRTKNEKRSFCYPNKLIRVVFALGNMASTGLTTPFCLRYTYYAKLGICVNIDETHLITRLIYSTDYNYIICTRVEKIRFELVTERLPFLFDRRILL